MRMETGIANCNGESMTTDAACNNDERGLIVSPFYEYTHLFIWGFPMCAIFLFNLRIQCPLTPEVSDSYNA
jgi:hypothetical protein